jgi:hypothetical protein
MEEPVKQQITLSREQAQEMAWLDRGDTAGGYVIAENRQVEERRWVSVHELVIRQVSTGSFYRAFYERGLTEYQDTEPFDKWSHPDGVTFTRVTQKPVTAYVYEDVAA